MNIMNVMDSDDTPPGVNVILIKWACRKVENEWETTDKYAGICATTKNADQVIIRAGMHDTTNTRQGKRVKDPRGWHYTAEYRDRKTLRWTTWHHYFIKQSDGSFSVNDQPAVSPNPEFRANDNKGKPSTKTPDQRKLFDKVWAWKQGGKQYVKLTPAPEYY